MRFATVVASVFLSFAAPFAVAAEPPAALVMAITGSTIPALSEMSEIPSGTPIKLAPGAELTILDYARCKMVTVSGGTLSVTRFDFTTDGKVTAEAAAPCPSIHQLTANTGGAVAGGLVMRGVGSVPRWPTNREIILAGVGADKLTAAAIYAEAQPDILLVQLDVSGHRARFPAAASSLPINDRYVLRLTMANRAAPVDIPFIGVAPFGPHLLVVLRDP